MSKVMDDIAARLGPEAAAEFRKAADGMHLLDNSNGSYVRKEKAEAELAALKKELEARNSELAAGFDGVKANFEAELAAMRTQAEREKKSMHIRQDLIQAGALDPDLALTALGLDAAALDALAFDSTGKLAGQAERIKDLQEKKTFLFNVRSPRGTHIPPAENNTKPGDMVREALSQIGYK